MKPAEQVFRSACLTAINQKCQVQGLYINRLSGIRSCLIRFRCKSLGHLLTIEEK
jgi:hypothetical protein